MNAKATRNWSTQVVRQPNPCGANNFKYSLHYYKYFRTLKQI